MPLWPKDYQYASLLSPLRTTSSSSAWNPTLFHPQFELRISQEESMSCRTNCCKKFMLICALLAMAIMATPASAANNCLADVDPTIAKHLGGSTCTANDVRIAAALNPRNVDGTPISTCFAGVPFSFIADFQVVTTATAREDIGLY